MTIKPEDITASLRRMADVETSVLYSQRTTLIGAADEIERLRVEKATVTAAYGDKCDALLDAVIEREDLKAETAKLTVACATYEAEAAGLREQLAGARGKALDEACELVATITRDALKDSEGVSPPDYFDEGTSAAYEAIRALKDSAP